jgi:hypothetical protein
MAVKPGHVSLAATFPRKDLTDDEVSTLYKWAALHRANVTWRQPAWSTGRPDWQLEISMSDPTSDAADLMSAALADVALMLRGEVIPAQRSDPS